MIDNAIRRAVVDRGVTVRLLVAALHHVPQTLAFLDSLEAVNSVNRQGTLEIVIRFQVQLLL